ncbi:PIN domain-containing protein [Thermovibrio ammonificans]|uniref:NYN domain-containing protein n=1 Tax=Thermovibrio ammonificans (strain DSM 15698 / JCM 12110 / HB-1) TaxID=648996 RepID=E8T4Y0_THEA1|nr:NYN domain-containing protein [Thermovibrio ammonificans]ADU97512.1 hypothetical protein Theam_1553 [Thermovibrio ammonificans HB-1]
MEERRIKTAIYVDFDNIYGALLSIYQMAPGKDRNELSPFQAQLLKLLIPEFLKLLKNGIIFTGGGEDIYQDSRCIKIFAEYHNLPYQARISPPLTHIVQEVGAVTHNPFIPSSKKGKGKNAADVALVLSVIEDLLIKRIPVDAVVIATCDIDLYPAIRWLKEHTGLSIILASFEGRINSIYLRTLNSGEIWFLNDGDENRDYTIRTLKNGLSAYLNLIENGDINAYPNDKDLKYLEGLKNIVTEKVSLKSELVVLIDKVKNLNRNGRERDVYVVFKEKLIKGLRGWLVKNGYAKTGLIIKNWLPRWNLGIDEMTANQYLKKVVEEELPRHPEIVFECQGEKDGVIIGTFKFRSTN